MIGRRIIKDSRGRLLVTVRSPKTQRRKDRRDSDATLITRNEHILTTGMQRVAVHSWEQRLYSIYRMMCVCVKQEGGYPSCWNSRTLYDGFIMDMGGQEERMPC